MATFFVNVFIYVYTGLTFCVWFQALLLVWFFTFFWDRKRRAVNRLVSVWCRVYLALNPFWGYRIRGLENMPKGPCVMVVNHQGILDIVLGYTIFHPFKWVSKRELFHAPFIGWILRLGDHVGIDRGNRADAQRMVEMCVQLLRDGTSVMIFPEGTRSRSGQVLHFKSGAFAIALAAGVPVVPIVMAGPSETLAGLTFRPRRVRMRLDILPPVAVAEGTPAREYAAQVGQIVREHHVHMAPYYYPQGA